LKHQNIFLAVHNIDGSMMHNGGTIGVRSPVPVIPCHLQLELFSLFIFMLMKKVLGPSLKNRTTKLLLQTVLRLNYLLNQHNKDHAF